MELQRLPPLQYLWNFIDYPPSNIYDIYGKYLKYLVEPRFQIVKTMATALLQPCNFLIIISIISRILNIIGKNVGQFPKTTGTKSEKK